MDGRLRSQRVLLPFHSQYPYGGTLTKRLANTRSKRLKMSLVLFRKKPTLLRALRRQSRHLLVRSTLAIDMPKAPANAAILSTFTRALPGVAQINERHASLSRSIMSARYFRYVVDRGPPLRWCGRAADTARL